jgi:ubiquilin
MVEINVKCTNEIKLSVAAELSDTVKSLKEKIEDKLKDSAIPTPAGSQRLIFSGRVMKDEETLSIYKITDGNT